MSYKTGPVPGGEPQDSNKGQRKLRITQQTPANDSVTASYKQNIALKGPGLTGHSRLLLRNDGDTPASSPDKEGSSSSSQLFRFRCSLYLKRERPSGPSMSHYHTIPLPTTPSIPMSFCSVTSPCPSIGCCLVHQLCRIKVLRINGRLERTHWRVLRSCRMREARSLS